MCNFCSAIAVLNGDEVRLHFGSSDSHTTIREENNLPEENFANLVKQTPLEFTPMSCLRDYNSYKLVFDAYKPEWWKDYFTDSVKRKFVDFISNLSDSDIVSRNGFSIVYINNPSEDMQLASVTQNGYAIEYIDNPSEAVQLAAVTQNGDAIKYINTSSEDVQLAAVTQNGCAIEFINNPSKDVQLAAVTQKGWSIKCIDTPSEAILMAAGNNES